MSFLLEKALYFIEKDFELQKNHTVLSELGSSLTLPAILLHIGFLLSKSILKFQIPSKSSFPKIIEDNISLKKLPPLPKSDFLDFENIFISKTQQNLNNHRLIINALSHCLSILHKVIIGHSNVKNWIHPIQNVEDIDDDLKYCSVDKFLLLNYSSLFAILNVCNELTQKSQSFHSDIGADGQIYSSIFYDISSTSNVLKLQTYQIFDDLFQLYDTFAFFKLIKFIMNVSMTDLELQKFSTKILNHLLFNSNNGLKKSIESHDLIKKLLQQYVALWSDGSIEYTEFERFLGLQSKPTELVNFDSMKYLEFLGFELPDQSTVSNLSPSTASSSSSIMPNFSTYANHSNNFNIAPISSASTPNYSYVVNPNNISTTTTNNNINMNNNNNNSGYFNMNPNILGNNRGISSGGNTTPSAGNFIINDGTNYKNSNISNVQSFIPQQQIQQQFNGINMKRAQSVHVDQFGR